MTIATDTLRDVCKRNVAVEQMVQQCQKEHSGGRVQLRDILSVPMQRILKYHLLLDKLVHETSPTHEDYRGLERAKEAMVDVAQYTNEVKRDSEHLVVIQKVRVRAPVQCCSFCQWHFDPLMLNILCRKASSI